MLDDLSLHILDIAQNSLIAGAKLIHMELREYTAEDALTLLVSDDGCGMTDALLDRIRDPFTTTRTSRRVGLGVPMLAQLCTQCGGALTITSKMGEGTALRADMRRSHIDRPPLGDLAGTLYILCLTSGESNIWFKQTFNRMAFVIDTAEIKKRLQCSRFDPSLHGKRLKTAIDTGLAALSPKANIDEDLSLLVYVADLL